MKLTYEQKVNAYKEWKELYKPPYTIARELGIDSSNVKYFLRLTNKHGVKILEHSENKYYSPKEKLRIINRVLVDNESINSVSIDEGLSGSSTLNSWIKSYKENGYTIVEKKRGRKTNGQEENNRTTRTREQGTEEESIQARNRELILKKIRCLDSRKRTITTKEIVKAISELIQYNFLYLL